MLHAEIMKKKPPEPEQKHHPPGGGHPPNPPGGGPPNNPPGGDQPPSTTNVLLLKIIAQQQEDHALLLEMQKEVRHNHEESKKCCKELKEDIEEIDEKVEETLDIVKEILVLVTPPAVTDFGLVQLKGDSKMAIIGVQAGGSGDFLVIFVPANGAPLQSGPTWTTDDSLVTLSAAPNGNPLGFVATVDASDAIFIYVKVDGTNSLVPPSRIHCNSYYYGPPPVADFDLTSLLACRSIAQEKVTEDEHHRNRGRIKRAVYRWQGSANGVLQSGPVFSVADASITLKPTNDPSTIVGWRRGRLPLLG